MLTTLGIKGLLLKPVLKGVLAKEIRRVLDSSTLTQPRGCMLVIGNEASIRLLFKKKLGNQGCEIIEAENDAQGLKLSQQTQPDWSSMI